MFIASDDSAAVGLLSAMLGAHGVVVATDTYFDPEEKVCVCEGRVRVRAKVG